MQSVFHCGLGAVATALTGRVSSHYHDSLAIQVIEGKKAEPYLFAALFACITPPRNPKIDHIVSIGLSLICMTVQEAPGIGESP